MLWRINRISSTFREVDFYKCTKTREHLNAHSEKVTHYYRSGHSCDRFNLIVILVYASRSSATTALFIRKYFVTVIYSNICVVNFQSGAVTAVPPLLQKHD